MKSVIISAILLIAVTAGVTLNSLYTQKTVDTLTEYAEKLSTDTEIQETQKSIFEHMNTEWEEKKNVLIYLYDYSEIENIETAFVRIKSAINSENMAEIAIYKGELLYFLSRLKELSTLSFKNIL